LEGILTLMIRRAKRLESMKFVFTTHLNIFGSKLLLTLAIMDFEIVSDESCSYLCDRKHECIIYII
jgi:hypothetical protein